MDIELNVIINLDHIKIVYIWPQQNTIKHLKQWTFLVMYSMDNLTGTDDSEINIARW